METQSNVHTEVHSCDSDCGRNYCSPCKKPQRALFNYCTDKSADPWKLKRGRGVGGGGGGRTSDLLLPRGHVSFMEEPHFPVDHLTVVT